MDSAESFRLEGTLSLEGPDPFGRTLLLVDGEGIGWPLDPGPHEHELSLLGGHEMRLHCRRTYEGGRGTVTVVRYELLPVDGNTPLYGTLRVIPGSIRIEADDSFVDLHGPLSQALCGFEGCIAWVWGKRSRQGAGDITVEGYVVIGKASPGP
jgi:hypothetical protein